MKLKRSKQWFEDRIALEGECEIGAGNPHFGKKLTWADKVRKAIATSPELQERLRIFNYWKSMVKSKPEKYRITQVSGEFTLEEVIIMEHEYDDFTIKWLSIDRTQLPNRILDYIYKI